MTCAYLYFFSVNMHRQLIGERFYIWGLIRSSLRLSPRCLWPGIPIRSTGLGRVLSRKERLLLVRIVVGISVLRDETVAVQVYVRLVLEVMGIGSGALVEVHLLLRDEGIGGVGIVLLRVVVTKRRVEARHFIHLRLHCLLLVVVINTSWRIR
jgi:hypothetical protein